MRQQYHSRQVGDDKFIWDIHRLVRLSQDLTVICQPLSAIAELDENWWYSDDTVVPTPRSVAAHMRLVQNTDLAHPIILCADGRLMDGMHRAVKALMLGREHLDAVQFSITPEPDYVNVSLEDLPYSADTDAD